MEIINIVELSVDDWSAIYVNGKIFKQDHCVAHKYLELLETFLNQTIIIESVESHYFDDLDLDLYGGYFPTYLNELVEYEG